MTKAKKLSAKEKEQHLIEKITKSKEQLLRLQNKRRLEIGKLAYKHGLEALPNKLLDKEFARIAKDAISDK